MPSPVEREIEWDELRIEINSQMQQLRMCPWS